MPLLAVTITDPVSEAGGVVDPPVPVDPLELPPPQLIAPSTKINIAADPQA
jgi:hypothetical protein